MEGRRDRDQRGGPPVAVVDPQALADQVSLAVRDQEHPSEVSLILAACAACLADSARSAGYASILVGMQPTFRQVPPNHSWPSTRATDQSSNRPVDDRVATAGADDAQVEVPHAPIVPRARPALAPTADDEQPWR